MPHVVCAHAHVVRCRRRRWMPSLAYSRSRRGRQSASTVAYCIAALSHTCSPPPPTPPHPSPPPPFAHPLLRILRVMRKWPCRNASAKSRATAATTAADRSGPSHLPMPKRAMGVRAIDSLHMPPSAAGKTATAASRQTTRPPCGKRRKRLQATVASAAFSRDRRVSTASANRRHFAASSEIATISHTRRNEVQIAMRAMSVASSATRIERRIIIVRCMMCAHDAPTGWLAGLTKIQLSQQAVARTFRPPLSARQAALHASAGGVSRPPSLVRSSAAAAPPNPSPFINA